MPARRRAPALDLRWAPAVAGVLALAAVLRLWDIHQVPGNVFYDAAVRSMGHSWHNLFFGALEPGGQVSIDKPPIDLWLQVAATKAVAFSLTSLHLPEALAGIAAVALLGDTVRRIQGRLAGLLAALFLAVLPASVLTARSDTMDALLALLAIAALALSCHALSTGRWRWAMAAAAVMGVAFNVKLAEALIPLPALALLWWWAAPRLMGRRVAALGAAAAVYVGVALSWTIAVALTPLSQRPFPIGSGTGSVWRLLFVYNGTARLSGRGAIGSAARAPGGTPGPLRLFAGGSAQWGTLIGITLVAALLLGVAALVVYRRTRPAGALTERERIAIALAVWLGCGLVLFSAMTRLEQRYLDSFTPSVAAIAGMSLAYLLARAPSVAAWCAGAIAVVALVVSGGVGGWVVVGLVAALVGVVASGRRGLAVTATATASMAVCVGASVSIVRSHTSDSFLHERGGVALGAYLIAHRHGARYAVAGERILDLTGIVARDGLPVLVINDLHAPIVHLAALRSIVAARQVRYLYLPHVCRGRHCPSSQPWVLAHSRPVSGQPGLREFTAGVARA